jgi:hypothetical protein
MTQEYAHSLFEYKDGNLYWKVRKAPHVKIGARVGSPAHGYETVSIDGRNWRIHRLIFLMQYGYIPHMIDHINGVPNDNRIENLREANKQTNTYNVGLRINNKTGIKGVSWNTKRQTWAVRVNHNKKTYQRYVQDLELAELVAIEMRNKLHGEFVNHGNPTLARPTEEQLKALIG